MMQRELLGPPFKRVRTNGPEEEEGTLVAEWQETMQDKLDSNELRRRILEAAEKRRMENMKAVDVESRAASAPSLPLRKWKVRYSPVATSPLNAEAEAAAEVDVHVQSSTANSASKAVAGFK